MFYAVYIGIILFGLFVISAIFRFIMTKKLNESNALLWLCIGLVILLAGLFPSLIVKISEVLLITYPPALVFTVSIIILLLIVLKNTIINSELSAKVQEIAMEVSLLKYELKEKEIELENLKSTIYTSQYTKTNLKDIQEVAQTYTVID